MLKHGLTSVDFLPRDHAVDAHRAVATWFAPVALVAAITLSLFLPSSLALAADVRVLHAESIVIDSQALNDTSTGTRATRKSTLSAGTSAAPTFTRQLRFNAYGRNFLLQLESLPQLNKISADTGASARSFRGTLADRPNSWVRLTQTKNGLHGLLSDGSDIYAIEPAREIADADSRLTAEQLAGTVIFRLADTITDLGPQACGARAATDTLDNVTAPHNGKALYKNLSSELKADMATANLSTANGLQLQMSAVMDSAFRQEYASDADATDAIIARVNNIDGIFSSQVGVSVSMIYVAPVASPSNSVLSASTDANTLLTSLSKLRAADSNLSSTGLTHLFTGRNLDGDTVGISYIDALCSPTYAATLSESRGRGAWFDSLVAAHEFGHSFGATHDGDSTGSCASTPTTFLMAAVINGNDQFSACSLNVIVNRAHTSSCLVPIPMADISITPDLGTLHAGIDQQFTWTIVATNNGGANAVATQLKISLPANLEIISMQTDVGSCSQGAGSVTCTADTLLPQQTQTVTLNLQSAYVGTFQSSVVAVASADANESNNIGTSTIVIEAPAQAPAATSPGTNTSDSPPLTPVASGGGMFDKNLLLMLLALLVLSGLRQKRLPIG